MLKTEPIPTKVPTFCNLPHTKIILNSWREVSMCCHQLTQLGTLDENTEVLDLWRNNLAQAIRKRTEEGELHPVCKSWNSCPFLVRDKKVGMAPTYHKSAYPMHLEISLPDSHCNIGGENPSDSNPACIMCRRNFTVSHTEDLTPFLCRKAKPLMPYLRSLCVLGIAEPFWKEKAFEVMDLLGFEEHRDNILFTTNTNGICLTERMTRQFFKTVKWSDISWSLDSATRETHIKIRRLDAFNLVVNNLRRWIKLRKENGGQAHHTVSIYNNINLLNVHEMSEMVELAANLGVDKMTMLPTYDQAGVVQLGELILSPKNINIFKEASRQAMTRAKELGLNLHYSKSFEELPPPLSQPSLI